MWQFRFVRSLIYEQSHSHAQMHTHTHVRAQTRTHTNTLTHTNKQTHTHTCGSSAHTSRRAPLPGNPIPTTLAEEWLTPSAFPSFIPLLHPPTAPLFSAPSCTTLPPICTDTPPTAPFSSEVLTAPFSPVAVPLPPVYVCVSVCADLGAHKEQQCVPSDTRVWSLHTHIKEATHQPLPCPLLPLLAH